MAFKEIASTSAGSFFKWPTHGTMFEGTFLSLGQGTYQNRTTYHAKFRKADGSVVSVNTPSSLRRRLGEEFKPGQLLRVTYTHDEKGNQPQPIKMFKIELDEEGSSGTPAGAAKSYDELAAMLKAKLGAGADALLNALGQLYPDEAERVGKLKATLQQHGVAA